MWTALRAAVIAGAIVSVATAQPVAQQVPVSAVSLWINTEISAGGVVTMTQCGDPAEPMGVLVTAGQESSLGVSQGGTISFATGWLAELSATRQGNGELLFSNNQRWQPFPQVAGKYINYAGETVTVVQNGFDLVLTTSGSWKEVTAAVAANGTISFFGALAGRRAHFDVQSPSIQFISSPGCPDPSPGVRWWRNPGSEAWTAPSVRRLWANDFAPENGYAEDTECGNPAVGAVVLSKSDRQSPLAVGIRTGRTTTFHSGWLDGMTSWYQCETSKLEFSNGGVWRTFPVITGRYSSGPHVITVTQSYHDVVFSADGLPWSPAKATIVPAEGGAAVITLADGQLSRLVGPRATYRASGDLFFTTTSAAWWRV